MAKLQIIGINNEKYSLIDLESQKEYQFELKFYGLKNNLKIGDKLGFHDELLDPKYKEYSQSYQFGPIDEIYGRNVAGLKDIDSIMLLVDNEKIYLKRFFG